MLDSYGFDIFQGEAKLMAAAHRHQDIELNVIFRGAIRYLFGGRTLELGQNQVALFWAASPHRLIASEEGTQCGWLTLPLANFLRYGLPDQLTANILKGKPIITALTELEKQLFERWHKDMQQADRFQNILELELEAWLRRMALKMNAQTSQVPLPMNSKAAKLAHYISEHYQQDLTLQCIATAVALNPSYAATLFKRSFGMTLGNYLTQHRIAHAQRLLVTTDSPILEIAFEAGFGSSSQFYVAFEKSCGVTPLAYRRTLSTSPT